MKLPRRRFLHLAADAAALAAVPRFAWAQAYPTRTITLIVPFAAGGPTDITARIIGEHMSRTLGQQIIIENVVGAGGTAGSIRAMRATPDGHTILWGQIGTHAASVAFYPNLAYKPDVDFEPVGLGVEQAVLILAKKDLPPKDLKEFISYVKANVEKLNNATDFSFTPTDAAGNLVANRVEGGKRPRSAMAPMIVLDDRHRFFAALGSPGGNLIIQFVVKTLLGILDWNLDIQRAIDLGNFGATTSAITSLEKNSSVANTGSALRALGHRVEITDINSGIHGIVRSGDPQAPRDGAATGLPQSRGFVGGADPRREGTVVGTEGAGH